MRLRTWALGLGLVGAGCAPPPAKTVVAPAAPPKESVAVSPTPRPEAPPALALVDPYLVAVELPAALPPPTLRGRILRDPLPTPLSPPPPTTTVPLAPTPAPSSPSPKPPAASPTKAAIPPAVVRLLEDERARTVDAARDRLAAATTRATQTAAEAKRQWGFVKEGFVAQKVAESADAAARDAVVEQANAQKSVDDAQSRQRSARRDLQAAFGAVALAPTFEEAALDRPVTSYQAAPFTYRLSLVGAAAPISVENGTLGRALPVATGEGAAWLVRCVDPGRLRVKVGGRAAALVVHTLQRPSAGVKA